MLENVKTIEQAAAELKGQVQTAATEAANTAVLAVKTTAEAATAEAAKALATAEKTGEDLKTVNAYVEQVEARLKAGATGASEGKSALTVLEENKEAIAAVKCGSRKSVTLNFDTKAAVTVSSASYSGSATPITVLGGVVSPPQRRARVRAFLPVGQMNTAKASYLQYTGSRTVSAAMVAEGGKKPLSDLAFQTVELAAKKIAHGFKITEETATDFPLLLSTIQQQGVVDVDLVEDAQILLGDGTGQNLNGIYTQAVAFTGGGVKAPTPTNFDVLRAAVAQLELEEFMPTLIMLNPKDVADMELEKGADGHYMLPTFLTNVLPSVAGVRIVASTAITAGAFLVGDFQAGAQLFDREGLSVRIYDQNEDDALNNLLLIIIEKRVALAVRYPRAFVKGTFAAGKTTITAA